MCRSMVGLGDLATAVRAGKAGTAALGARLGGVTMGRGL